MAALYGSPGRSTAGLFSHRAGAFRQSLDESGVLPVEEGSLATPQ